MTIQDSNIDSNWVLAPGAAVGGVYATGNSNVIVSSCKIRRNRSNTNAGAFGSTGNNCVLSNCLIAENVSPFGGFATVDGSLRISNCTIVGNISYGTSTPFGRVQFNCSSGSHVIENSIFWGITGIDIYTIPGCTTTTVNVSYSDIGVAYIPMGAGVISADPRFASPDESDFHLTASSPCRNAGNPAATGLQIADIDGSSRVVGAAVDMRCDELQTPLYPGTSEDLDFAVWFNGTGDPEASTFHPLAAQVMHVRFGSPGGTFAGASPVFMAQAYVAGNPPGAFPGNPAIHINLVATFAILYGSLLPQPFPAPGLPPEGWYFDAQTPPGLTGTVVRLQGFVLSPFAANGFYAATSARDVVLP